MPHFLFFFSFKGRASRTSYWLQFAVAILLFFITSQAVIFGMLLSPTLRVASCGRLGCHSNLGEAAAIVLPLLLLDILLYGWAMLAISVRRCHDLGHSGKMLAQLKISSRELGFKRGTAGPNAYGPDPLGR